MTTADKEAIRAFAVGLGFDAVGFTTADADAQAGAHLRTYLAEGRHGTMAWMAATADRRVSPRALWPEASSVICLGVNYTPDEDPLAVLADRAAGAISVYARGDDYHVVVKAKLKALARWLQQRFGGEMKVFVDTAPVMEKPLAQRAGIGWIGKHTNLVSRRFGSWLFLGEVMTTLELPADRPETDHCGSCDRCLRACPTGALPEPYRIEPRRCLSYLTIEHAGPVPQELARALGNRVYGCDDCLAVCPWNTFAPPTREPRLQARDALRRIALTTLASLDDPSFRARLAGTAIKRSGVGRLVRNAELALANVGAADLPAGRPATSSTAPAPTGSAPRDAARSGSG